MVVMRIAMVVCAAFALTTSKAQLSANFASDNTQGCAPLLVHFFDRSNGLPTSWVWDLGNGIISTQQNPTAFYFLPGSYNVKLIARNSSGVDSIVKNQYIQVFSNPVIAFTASDTSGCLPLSVQYTDQSIAGSGTITSWQWDMGDGTFSSQQNPAHTYSVTGSFAVTLKVKNSAGCSQILSKPAFINTSAAVAASFDVVGGQACNAPATVSFVNTSTGPLLSIYKWDFGDGGTSTLANPTYTYAAPGIYTVKLVVKNNIGCADSIVKTSAVNIATVTAAFTMPASVCEGTTVTFTNTSLPVPTTSFWDFGDGTTSTDTNAVKTFNVPGTYRVKLTNGTGACSDTTSQLITIKQKPSAAFTSVIPPPGCILPANTSFTSTGSNIASYAWSFGDGGTSTSANPSHVYNAHGVYDVTLVVTGTNGCTNQLTKPAHVVNVLPVINYFFGVPHRGCAPFTSDLAANISSPEDVASYLWNFGDGNTSTLAQPSHNYPNPGAYTISLTITTVNGCTASFSLADAIVISTKPTANFSATPLSACANEMVHFTNLSTGPVTRYQWLFGDGSTASDPNPVHHYRDTGYFTVKLFASNNECVDSLVIDSFIHISPPIASFVTTLHCDTPMLRRFVDKSIGATTWLWNFGDGVTDTQVNPSHTYSAPGTYYVSLHVENGTCQDDYIDTVIVNNGITDYTFSDTATCHISHAYFQAVNPDPSIVLFTWNFGDGTVISGPQPTASHTFVGSNAYNTSLTTTDVLGCVRTINHTVNISVFGPNANFTNAAGACINTATTFTDASQAAPGFPVGTRIWDFGDGKKDTVTSATISHTYTTAGTYTVKLVVSDGYVCYDSIIKTQAILITDPQVDFSILDTIKCPNDDVRFTQNAQGYNLQYNWSFGDATTSTIDNPVHQYRSPGRYDVTLKVTDQFGCIKSLTKPLAIRITEPLASFTMSDTGSTCPPFILKLINTSSYFTSSLWDFDDGSFSTVDTPSHFYNTPGIYNIKLTVTGYGSCTKTFVQRLNIKGPTGSITYSPLSLCIPGTAQFVGQTKNSQRFLWDFGDGNTVTGTDSTVSHVYTDPGIYTPKLLLTDSTGCSVPISGAANIVVADVNALIDSIPPVYCDSVNIQFQNVSTASFDNIASYAWDFGDGFTSTVASPSHHFGAQGIYAVKMKVLTAKGCTDSLTTVIKVVNSPAVAIIADTSVCIDKQVRFAGQLTRPDTSQVQWLWNFGNGNTSVLQNPAAQSYAAAGSYNVMLVAANSSGCVDTAKAVVVIHPLPPVNAGADTAICLGQSLLLQPSGAATYVWAANSTLSCTNCNNPVATPTQVANTYYVTGTSAAGCISFDTINVKVVQPFTVTFSETDTLCEGESKQLLATGADFYTWSPSTGLSNPSIADPVAKPVITTNYMVIGRDYKSCFFDTGYVPIVVYPIPGFDIVAGNLMVAAGTPVSIQTTNSADIIKWKWVPAAGLSCADCPQPIATVSRDMVYRAFAINPGGCVKEDEVRITVICNGGNVFIPNTFSPNSDGMNDVFYVRGKGLNGVKSMRIFNRWGSIVYEKYNSGINDPNGGWDGSFNGKKLAPDVYIYEVEVICENNQVFSLKGNVTLIK